MLTIPRDCLPNMAIRKCQCKVNKLDIVWLFVNSSTSEIYDGKNVELEC
jgi:hypothetical protein